MLRAFKYLNCKCRVYVGSRARSFFYFDCVSAQNENLKSTKYIETKNFFFNKRRVAEAAATTKKIASDTRDV